jgi:queuine/archaeosine tRNA-ribosyltransferase
VPERLEFVPVELLRDGTCDCSTCRGRPLRRLASAEEIEVNTHNARALHRLHNRLLRSTHRERWWRELTA